MWKQHFPVKQVNTTANAMQPKMMVKKQQPKTKKKKTNKQKQIKKKK